MTMSINRQQIVDALYFGYAKECLGPVHPAHKEFYNPNLKPLPFDQEAAKQLFAEVGWTDSDGDGILDKDGKPFAFKMKTNLNNKQRVDALTMIQADLQKVGIDMTPEVLEFNVLIDQQTARDYEAMVLGWRMGAIFDPSTIWHSRSIVDGYNKHNYTNAVTDSLIDLGRKTLDNDKAREIWYEFQDKLYAEQPYTFLYVQDNIDGVSNKFKGIITSPGGIFYNVNEWWIEEE